MLLVYAAIPPTTWPAIPRLERFADVNCQLNTLPGPMRRVQRVILLLREGPL